jgi:hypothetical protein
MGCTPPYDELSDVILSLKRRSATLFFLFNWRTATLVSSQEVSIARVRRLRRWMQRWIGGWKRLTRRHDGLIKLEFVRRNGKGGFVQQVKLKIKWSLSHTHMLQPPSTLFPTIFT